MFALPNVRFLFARRKRASEKTNGSIEIEVCYAGERVRLASGIGVLKNQWKNGKVVNRLDAQRLNKELTKKYDEVYDAVMQMVSEDNVCLAKLKGYKFGESRTAQKINPLDWMEERIMLRDIEENTRKHHLVTLRSLRASKLFLSFKDFTTSNIKKWDDMLHEKVNAQSTIHSYHKRLKPYISEAIQLGLIEKSPYEGLHISRGNSQAIRFITEEYRDKIEKLILSSSAEEKARDLFIFACYTGLAYSDIVKISSDDIHEEKGVLFLQDKRKKTGGQ